MMKTYTMLTKPGIILGNIITTAGGFALASQSGFDFRLFLATLLGLALIIASAGVFNNIIDRQSDAKMARTKNRPLVQGTISMKNALIFGSVLGLVGVMVLSNATNYLTVAVALGGFFTYLILYAIMKYRSFYGTLVGSLAGAVPPLVGYTAVSDRFDLAALLLFAILVLWQMPHFFAIAIFHLKDYKAASIPVLPIVKGLQVTKIQMVLYIIVFTLTTLLLTLAGYTGSFFAWTTLILGAFWLGCCIKGFFIPPQQEQKWGRQMFLASLAVITGIFVAIPLEMYSNFF